MWYTKGTEREMLEERSPVHQQWTIADDTADKYCRTTGQNTYAGWALVMQTASARSTIILMMPDMLDLSSDLDEENPELVSLWRR